MYANKAFFYDEEAEKKTFFLRIRLTSSQKHAKNRTESKVSSFNKKDKSNEVFAREESLIVPSQAREVREHQKLQLVSPQGKNSLSRCKVHGRYHRGIIHKHTRTHLNLENSLGVLLFTT